MFTEYNPDDTLIVTSRQRGCHVVKGENMSALIRHLALVSESSSVAVKDVMRVAAALQKQAVRDLAPIWEISATVDAFATLEDVPLGYWHIIVMDDIGEQDAAGVHMDRDNQPFALVRAAADIDDWALTASHEMLEMLVDPFGNRLVAGDSPKSGQGRVEFLVEVSDPSEAADFGYSANGILVSDFYTPRFFDPVGAPGVRYSYTGAITGPRQVLRGGYLSWHELVSDHWWQEVWFGGGSKPAFRDLGQMDTKAGSIRSQIDRMTSRESMRALAPGRKSARSAGLTAAATGNALFAKASYLKEQIAEIVGNATPPTTTSARHASAAAPRRRPA